MMDSLKSQFQIRSEKQQARLNKVEEAVKRIEKERDNSLHSLNSETTLYRDGYFDGLQEAVDILTEALKEEGE